MGSRTSFRQRPNAGSSGWIPKASSGRLWNACGNTFATVPRGAYWLGAANDSSALGALRAFQECGRSAYCTVVGEGGEPEARAEMRENGTRLIGSVAFFPERYGDTIVRIATDVLLGKSTTPAAYTTHQLVTPENVNRLYPNDALFVQLAREYD